MASRADSNRHPASQPIAVSLEQMRLRLVRYAELRPCTNAFIDTHTPGSDRKENFTIIGPGVAENPEQHVHIRIPHGFNIGGARQPPGCTNSQHSHETAEVFVIHHGGFRFKTGERGTSGHVDLAPGDVISIPTRAFRGFDTLGSESSFMFSVLGGDDPGRVLWAPYVFDAARQHGLVLLASGRLIDTHRGERVPPDEQPMPTTSATDHVRLRRHHRKHGEAQRTAGCAARPVLPPAGHRGMPDRRRCQQRGEHAGRAACLASRVPPARAACRGRRPHSTPSPTRGGSAADASRHPALRVAGRHTPPRTG